MMQMLGQGFLVSLQLFVLTLLGSIPLGIPVAFMRMSKIAPLRWIARIYISVMRGTPLMLQMFAIYFAPYYVFGISLTPDSKWTACVVAFIINYAGYFAEIYRSGLQSIPRGQYEAAEVLGYSRVQTFLYIVMPQVAKRILPAMGNEIITLVKDTSLAFAIGVGEMFSTAKALVASQVSMVPFAIAALIYWVFNFVVGSGKSTLMHLLLGFRAPTQGRILFDGRDAAGLSKHTLRRGISSVLQGAAIYSGTIGENIRMGDPDADDAAVTEAARIAQLADFIASCDGGLSYEIRQAGKNLSGGQKQRLAIARAIIKDAPIYIFDDSFSALDFLTEKNLRTALNRRIAGRTQIVVTQRITSAMSADCIFVMDGGCLVDIGTHDELLARCRIYREIYASQTGGDLQ